jgi:hypothetical protein
MVLVHLGIKKKWRIVLLVLIHINYDTKLILIVVL